MPIADKLLEDAAVENDAAKRVALFMAFQQLVEREVPDLNLCSPLFLTLSNTRVLPQLTRFGSPIPKNDKVRG